MTEAFSLRAVTAGIVKSIAASTVARNILANAVGRAWVMVVNFAVVPVYIHILGIRAYGLIGFAVALSVTLSILDLGLNATLNRELARYSIEPEAGQASRNLIRTFEAIYWAASAAIAFTIAIASPFIARRWLHGSGEDPQVLAQSTALMGVAIACQWPTNLYLLGGLNGLQRQLLANLIYGAITTARGLGAVLVLLFVWQDVRGFFLSQAVVGLCGTVVSGLAVWSAAPKRGEAPKFDLGCLRRVWRFASGNAGIWLSTLVLTQGDKLMLSAMLPLEVLGFYSVASLAAGASIFMAGSIFAASVPRMTQLVAADDQSQLKQIYHQACGLSSVVILPVAAVVAVFSPEVLNVWTGNPKVAQLAATSLSLLALSSALNALIQIPSALQLAKGVIRYTLQANVIAAVVFAPLLFILIKRWGTPGAAAASVLVNAGFLAFLLPVVHAKLMPGELRRWWLVDTGAPAIASCAVVAFLRVALHPPSGRAEQAIFLSFVGIVTFGAAACASPLLRERGGQWLSRRFVPVAAESRHDG